VGENNTMESARKPFSQFKSFFLVFQKSRRIEPTEVVPEEVQISLEFYSHKF